MVRAKDRVVVQPPDKASPLIIAGDVVDYTSKTLSLHINDQLPIRTFPSDQVIAVEVVQTDPHREGVRLSNMGAIDEATGQFTQALEDEPRDWVKREIMGWLVRCAMRHPDRATAGIRFLQITQNEQSAREWPLIPLVWDSAELSTSLRQQARQWLTGDDDVARLLGASCLLLDTAYADVTRSTLRRLARSGDPMIASLATAQLWRLSLTSGVSRDELARWQSGIQSMPSVVRAGPYFVLGRALSQESEYDQAAAAFLWLPTVFRENETLTSQATVNAGAALMRLGRIDEARSLWKEVTEQAGWSLAAAEARSLLDQTTPPKDARTDG
ncbi:MAG: hypothetical protein KDA86_03335 [Planctomycetaceae bacterium]|nr:hypothetical protein [Planctomycetaceae bacterium]